MSSPLRKYSHLRVVDFHLIEGDISIIFSSIKCLFATKLLVNVKLLVTGKLSAIGKFSVADKL